VKESVGDFVMALPGINPIKSLVFLEGNWIIIKTNSSLLYCNTLILKLLYIILYCLNADNSTILLKIPSSRHL